MKLIFQYNKLAFLSCLVVVMIITSCSNNNFQKSNTPTKSLEVPIDVSDSSLSLTPTLTAIKTITATPIFDISTPVPDPLTFTLPTPGAVPVSSWRPPLYPVPWALAEFDHFYFTRPVLADEVNWPLPFYRYGNVEFGDDRPHTGVDIVAPVGTPIKATGSGTVVWAGYGLFYGYEEPEDPYGLAIAIEHDFGFDGQPIYTAYAHLSEINVERGERVQIGEIIGKSGQTGNVTAAHLHFEVRVGANDYFHSVNPELWTSPPQGWGVLVGRVMSSGSALLYSQEIRITSLATGRKWFVQSYGTTEVINRDANYRENFVLSGLPAGEYEIFIPNSGYEHRFGIHIIPGAVTFFTYRGFNGFSTAKPLGILPDNIPE
ncbi:MAG: M23 family metallopeptidase [Chloroflexota bacterium]